MGVRMSGSLLLTAAIAVVALSLGAGASAAIPSDKEVERVVASVERPFVLINERELDALRRAVKTDGPKRDAYLRPLRPGGGELSGVSIRASADRWAAADITIPERGGHSHLFFCDCGTQLALPPDMQPKSQYSCPACGKTFSGEKFDAAVRCFRHHQIAHATLNLALAYAIDRDRKYSDKAAEILRKYAEAYPGPHTDHLTGGILLQSLNEAMWIIPLAQAYDLIHDSGSLSDADKRLIEDKLFRPAAEGIGRCGTGGNWGSWHLSAVGVVGLTIRDAGMVEFALKAFEAQMRDQLGDDGLWPESVHCYHFFPLQAFVFFAEAGYRAGIDLYNLQPKPGKGLRAMFGAPLQYMYPHFQLPAINDGWYAAWLPMNLYEIARLRWSDPAFAWALSEGYQRRAKAGDTVLTKSMSYLGGPSLYSFLFGSERILSPSKDAQPKPPLLKSTIFPNFGLCTLRNDRMMLTFHYGRFLGHGHPDKLSSTLYANDSLLSPDYGTPGYGSKILHWYQSTAAHNTVVVDGKTQARSTQNTLDAFLSGKVAQYAQATASDIYPGVSQTRRILVIGGACFIIDDLTSDAPHDFDWLFRCEGKPRLFGTYADTETDTACYPSVKFDNMRSFDDLYRVTWRAAKCNLAFGMWGGGIAALGNCPAEDDARHVSFLMCRQHGTSARFAAAFAPTEPGLPSSLTKTGGLIRVQSNGETIYLSLGAQSTGNLTTDADLAAVRIADSKVTGAFLANGSRLAWKGKPLIERASKTACAEVY